MIEPADMAQRLIDATVYNETADGPYRSGARRELDEARIAIEDEIGRLRDRLRKVETEARCVVSEWKHGFDNSRLTTALRDLEAELVGT